MVLRRHLNFEIKRGYGWTKVFNLTTRRTEKSLRSVFALGLLSLLTLTTACHRNNKTQQFLGGDEPGLFSNRPQSQTHFLAVVKLKNPSLLSQVDGFGRSAKIDSKLAEAIQKEQDQTIAMLKDLSSDVQVLYRYRMVMNGIAIVAPMSLADKIKNLVSVAYMENEGQFQRPIDMGANSKLFPNAEDAAKLAKSIQERNSVKFIGAEKAQKEMGIDGAGIRVGIIDTGIDYTHSMLGGVGTADAYKSVNPSTANSFFPNKKVVGGIDVVGTDYDSGSGDFKKHVPVPDENPLDEGGHGSHVAGTVAGIGDGIESYSGVAPAADLYAIKVFGAEGSTGDAAVIAGLEYAADPNKDGNIEDQLDVVNMSLGSGFGHPHILYGEAIKNLTNGGTVVVASAGNSGHRDFIVGAPSVVDEAISVAASVDDGFHNWQFEAMKFSVTAADGTVKPFLSEIVEAAISKPLKDVSSLSGSLVFAGLADQDFSEELKNQIKGNVAIIDRGKVAFAEKIRRAAEAGAVAAVVVNNAPGSPFVMGGEGKYEIPAVMISQELGTIFKQNLAAGLPVDVDFKTSEKMEKPNLIDTLTSFSSKGPRSLDGFFKPEISAPGSSVISAAMGEGNKSVKMSGTSMAGPHIAGVMALLKQKRSDLPVADLKSLLMGHALDIKDEKGVPYKLSEQGAGRVQVVESLNGSLVSSMGAFSLGILSMETTKVIRQEVTLKNVSAAELTVATELVAKSELQLLNPVTVTLKPNESKKISLKFKVNATAFKEPMTEVEGRLLFKNGNNEIHKMPVLAVVKKTSAIMATNLVTHAGNVRDADGALVEVTLKNESTFSGSAYAFNLLGLDDRKSDSRNDRFMSRACDLQAVGYRVIDKDVNGQSVKVLQVTVKTYDPMTTWNACETSVLIDGDGDGVADQELAGIAMENLKGAAATPQMEAQFFSVLLDAKKAQNLRAKFEQESQQRRISSVKTAAEKKKKPEENYAEAIEDALPMTVFNNSSVMIVEADVTKLYRQGTGVLSIKVATTDNDAGAIEMDDFLQDKVNSWLKISLDENSHAFAQMAESVSVNQGEMKAEMVHGQGSGDLMLLFPQNKSVFSDLLVDDEMQIIKSKFE